MVRISITKQDLSSMKHWLGIFWCVFGLLVFTSTGCSSNDQTFHVTRSRAAAESARVDADEAAATAETLGKQRAEAEQLIAEARRRSAKFSDATLPMARSTRTTRPARANGLATGQAAGSTNIQSAPKSSH